MIHPNSELRFVSPAIGYGVFATENIPQGTIVYVKDMLEVEVTPSRFAKLDQAHKDIIEKYSYMDDRGVRILSWDHAKYVNHRCDCNSMSTGYGFEIAIRNISKDEEITDEYGLFNINYDIELACQCSNCRGRLTPADIDNYAHIWDARIEESLKSTLSVDQPLWTFIDMHTRNSLMGYLTGTTEYRSVLSLKHKPKPINSPRRRRRSNAVAA